MTWFATRNSIRSPPTSTPLIWRSPGTSPTSTPLSVNLSHDDEGLRWWGIVGLHLLEQEAASATAAFETALSDDAHEIRMMAAWTLVNLGQPDQAIACLDDLLFGKCDNEDMLHNVLEWMGKPGLPLVKKYIENDGNRQGRYGIGILGRIAELNGW